MKETICPLKHISFECACSHHIVLQEVSLITVFTGRPNSYFKFEKCLHTPLSPYGTSSSSCKLMNVFVSIFCQTENNKKKMKLFLLKHAIISLPMLSVWWMIIATLKTKSITAFDYTRLMIAQKPSSIITNCQIKHNTELLKIPHNNYACTDTTRSLFQVPNFWQKT